MNNPPAFPNESNAGNIWNDKGMTLRDYFAAKAMQGLMHNYDICDFLEHKDWLEDISITSYQIADAMMRAREK
jgi:hypothetical protein